MPDERHFNHQILITLRGGGKESIEFATAEGCFGMMVHLKKIIATPAAERIGALVVESPAAPLITDQGLADTPTVIIEQVSIVSAKLFITARRPSAG